MIGLAIIVFAFMTVEARRAARNERAQRDRGGVEARGDVYKAMCVIYPAAFAAMILEGFSRGAPAAMMIAAGATLFTAAKLMKWWAITTLGRFWTFRVIVVPGSALIAGGPYRWLRHPNYVAVLGELVSVAMMTGASITGPVMTSVFMALLLKRVTVESRTLREARCPWPTSNR